MRSFLPKIDNPDVASAQEIKPVCVHSNKEDIAAFIYDQIRCSDCGAYMGEAVSS